MVVCRMVQCAERRVLWWGRRYSGEIGRGGGKFGEREHAQEEQYFRQKVLILIVTVWYDRLW